MFSATTIGTVMYASMLVDVFGLWIVSYQALVPILVIFVVLLVEPKGILEILSRVSRWIKKRQNALREPP